MTDTSKEQDAYRDRYLQNCTFIWHGLKIKSKALDFWVFVIRVQNAQKCRLMVSTNAKPRSSQMPGTGHPPMPILSAQRCLFAALRNPGHVAHNRRPLALTKAGSQGLAIDGPWRSQMWVSMQLTVNPPDRTCFEPSRHTSARLSITPPIFEITFLKGTVSRDFSGHLFPCAPFLIF